MQIFRNRHGELRSGWAILLVIALIVAGQLTAGIFAPDDADAAGNGLKVLVSLLYGSITIVGGVLLFNLLYKRPVRQIGIIFEKWISGLLHGAAIGALSMIFVFIALLLAGQATIVKIHWSKLASLSILIELFSLSIFAFSEELLTRGFIMTALKTTRNKYIVFFVPAFLFSLLHFLNPGVTILSFLNTFLAGLLFANLFVKSGKLWLPGGYHIAWNFLQGDILGMNVSGGEAFAVVQTQMGETNQFLSGGEYGPEGGIFVTVILILGFVYTHYFVKPSSIPSWTFESNLPM